MTNWDHGEMPLATLLECAPEIGSRERVLGADICGEYAPPAQSNPFKRWEAPRDQPRRGAVNATHLAANERVHRELPAALAGAGARC